MAEELGWKKRWIIIIAGIAIMTLGQGNLIQIIIGASLALVGIYYGTKDIFLAYLKKRIYRFWKYIRGFIPPL